VKSIEYNREKAVAYARKWALGRNPRFYNFSGIGGDCANFASQCIYEGIGVMNFTSVYGWYYRNLNDRAPAWTSVKYLHNFLTTNQGAGPYARQVGLEEVMPGDIIQIATWLPDFHHTLVVIRVGESPAPENIMIAAHSYDSLDRPLSSYDTQKIRCLHILGGRKQ